MGISDDITPPRRSALKAKFLAEQHSKQPEKMVDIFVSKPSKKVDEKVEVEAAKTDETAKAVSIEKEPHQSDEMPKMKKVEADFFGLIPEKKNEKKADTLPAEPKKSNLKKVFNWQIVWGLAVILIIILIVQNFSSIRAAVTKSYKKSATTSDSTATTITPQNYTTSDDSGTTADSTPTEPSTTPATTPTTTTPVATIAAIDKSAIKIEVLNGNGITGSADKVRDSLVADGFTVSKVTNAKKFTYATSIIYFKTGKDAEADLVKDALSGRTIATENDDSVVGTYDIVVVVGKK